MNEFCSTDISSKLIFNVLISIFEEIKQIITGSRKAVAKFFFHVVLIFYNVGFLLTFIENEIFGFQVLSKAVKK